MPEAGLSLPGVVGFVVLGIGVAIGLGVGTGWTAVLPAGALGVGVGLAPAVEFADGTGTKIIPPSCGMNWLPPLGSMVTT